MSVLRSKRRVAKFGMEVLNDKSLVDAMCRCNKYTGYRVAIIFRSFRPLYQFAESVKSNLVDGEYGIKTVSNRGEIRFANGSVIETYTENTRRAYTVYANEIILGGEDIVEECNALKFIQLKPYHCKEEPPEPDTSLDDFLGSFKICTS